ncbi:MAG: Vi polysaccharide biosynthesis protein VipA/TviB [Rickettsiales bacterium]|nr:Vi polysaccharide biosynthesis protein VipA/TviB [Rickettsiales bacterium]
MKENNFSISVIGLGYVGLPVAVAFGKSNYKVIGFDLNKDRLSELKNNYDKTGEVDKSDLKKSKIIFSNESKTLKNANFHIITVPTPIDDFKKPDLSHIIEVCKTLGVVLKKDDIVVIESTVYPGVTEEIAAPILENLSGLKLNKDFSIGYSPERINPADKDHTFENITKVVSASNIKALNLIEKVYESVVKAGIHKAPSIKVAEAAKVIENTQRDLNIAFMNELVKVFNGLDINTNDVLNAAETKWNFLPFRPGFVGGHCIGVDPYYLIHKSQQAGVIPDLLLSARKINDGMSSYFGQKIIKILNQNKLQLNLSNILILGLSFKENCPDIRNSKVFDLISFLKNININVDVFDPVVDLQDVKMNFDLDIKSSPVINKYDLIVITVPHNNFKIMGIDKIRSWCNDKGLILDLKNTFAKNLVDYTI